MITTTVSNLSLYHTWKEEEDLDLQWLLRKLRGEEPQTEAIKAGEALHLALELVNLSANFVSPVDTLKANGYTFDIECDIMLPMSNIRELPISKMYGDLQVRGRVDMISGKCVIDHKTTAQFDPDRLLNSFQWRFYLDMLEADTFRWNVFVLRPTKILDTYAVSAFHVLEQCRYPELGADCNLLSVEYAEFAKQYLNGSEASRVK